MQMGLTAQEYPNNDPSCRIHVLAASEDQNSFLPCLQTAAELLTCVLLYLSQHQLCFPPSNFEQHSIHIHTAGSLIQRAVGHLESSELTEEYKSRLNLSNDIGEVSQ
mmetsp:Transcript_49899/g.104123  ORF Transcript_49899/g.104123 Transcript_49899/m.104123 type:complete len:107 (+) Transcript_49899:509-829(+)